MAWPRALFQVLIMSDESRFGREQIDTAWALDVSLVYRQRVALVAAATRVSRGNRSNINEVGVCRPAAGARPCATQHRRAAARI
jgi:hypothetical protein